MYDEYINQMVEVAKAGYAWHWAIHKIMTILETAQSDTDNITLTEWRRMCMVAHDICSEYAKVHKDDIIRSIERHSVDTRWGI